MIPPALINDRAGFAKSSHLLKSMSKLQHAKIVAVAADQLNAHGQTIRCESRRHGNRRTKGGRTPVSRLHPIEVVVHLYAVDLMRPIKPGVEGRHLVHRADEKLILLMKATHALHQLA